MNRADTEYRKDIIAMAREAGFYKDQPMYYDESMLEAFAKLISEYERKFYMQLFLDSENQPTQFGTATQEYREQEVREAKQQEREVSVNALRTLNETYEIELRKAIATEREACAKWLEDVVDAPNWAEVIRARGQA